MFHLSDDLHVSFQTLDEQLRIQSRPSGKNSREVRFDLCGGGVRLSLSSMCSFEASHIGVERTIAPHLSISYPENIAHRTSDSLKHPRP